VDRGSTAIATKLFTDFTAFVIPLLWLLYVPPGLTFKQFYVLPTQCIYVFCVDLRTKSDYFTVQH
jgi:hypothetical protein